MRNLTPHPIVIYFDQDDRQVVLAPDPAGPARVAVTPAPAGTVDVDGVRISVSREAYGDIVGWKADDGPAIVSRMVLAAAPEGAPLYAPDTGATAVRDEDGRIVAVRGLIAR